MTANRPAESMTQCCGNCRWYTRHDPNTWSKAGICAHGGKAMALADRMYPRDINTRMLVVKYDWVGLLENGGNYSIRRLCTFWEHCGEYEEIARLLCR